MGLWFNFPEPPAEFRSNISANLGIGNAQMENFEFSQRQLTKRLLPDLGAVYPQRCKSIVEEAQSANADLQALVTVPQGTLRILMTGISGPTFLRPIWTIGGPLTPFGRLKQAPRRWSRTEEILHLCSAFSSQSPA